MKRRRFVLVLVVLIGLDGRLAQAGGPPSVTPPPVAQTSARRFVTGPAAPMRSAISGGPTATIALQPVLPKTIPSSDYPVGSSIVGTRLTLSSPAVRVWLEIQITGWAPRDLKTVQCRIDPSGYLGANATCAGVPAGGGDLGPAMQSCSVNSDCRASMSGAACPSEASRCQDRTNFPYFPQVGKYCQPGFQDQCDPEWCASGVDGVFSSDTSTLNYRYGATTNSAGDFLQDFGPAYAGTLVLDVPINARGLYTIGFDSNIVQTFMEDGSLPPDNNIPIAALIPGEIDLCNFACDGPPENPADRDCNHDGVCNGVEIADCQPGDTYCSDCNGNGIPDGCETDCNGNGIGDSCDIAHCPPNDPTCGDCTGNGIPDECELDCNENQIADSCDIANCPPGNADCADCNSNGILDGCEEHGCCRDLDFDGDYEICTTGAAEFCKQVNGILRGVCQPCPQQTIQVIDEGGFVFVHVISPPIHCSAEGDVGRRRCSPGGPFYDAWKSNPDALMCHDFAAPGHSIPADFFDPGSDVFADSVCMRGSPLGIPEFGEADTLIQRSMDPFDRCTVPPGNPVDVQLDIAALSLIGTEPVTVTYGGQNPELWNVAVDRSEVIAPPGVLTVTKTHCNGGTYTSVLNVQPRFTFTKVSDPGQVRVLDTGLAGIPYVVLDQQTPAPWVHDVDPNLGLTGDTCSRFHAGIDETNKVSDCDCNANLVRDLCDIEDAVSIDCNQNATPDECDISTGSSMDVELINGVPDECDPAPQPLADPTGIGKTRFISFSAPAPAIAAPVVSALRVRLVSLHHVVPPYSGGASIPFTSFEGQVRWVGPPALRIESASSETPFFASTLQCSPHYREWSTVGLLHVTGSAIVPSSVYEVENVGASCMGDEGNCAAVSAPLTITTTRWGDVEVFYNPPSATVQPDVGDISALVNKFRSVLGAPIKARALLSGDDSFGNISSSSLSADLNFSHIAACVDAFRGRPYPFVVEECP